MSEYVFEGEVIKLTAKDFYKWQDMYKHLSLVEELQQLDMELDAKRMEGGKVNKWFSECIARLNGRNKRAERFNRGSNQQPKSAIERFMQNHQSGNMFDNFAGGSPCGSNASREDNLRLLGGNDRPIRGDLDS